MKITNRKAKTVKVLNMRQKKMFLNRRNKNYMYANRRLKYLPELFTVSRADLIYAIILSKENNENSISDTLQLILDDFLRQYKNNSTSIMDAKINIDKDKYPLECSYIKKIITS